MEKINERALCFVYNDYTSTYSNLLDKGETSTLELRTIRFVCTEIYKIFNQIGPSYMSNLVTPMQSHYSSRRPPDLFVPRVTQTTYGLKSFRYQGSKLWNSLPDDIKTSSNLSTFKKIYLGMVLNVTAIIADLQNDNRGIGGYQFQVKVFISTVNNLLVDFLLGVQF